MSNRDGGKGERIRRAGALAMSAERPDAQVAVAMAKLRCLAHAVAQLGDACGLSPEQLARAESRDALEFTARLPVEQLATPAFAPLEDWFALLADDLALDLALAGLDPNDAPVAAEVRADPDPRGSFERFRARARRIAATQGDDVVVDLRVGVGKRRALAAAATIQAARADALGSTELAPLTRVVVYYQASAWSASLSLRLLSDWEQHGILPAEGRAIVVLCDAAGYLAGLSLDVFGARSPDAPDWPTVSRAAWRQYVERARAVRRLRDVEGGWPGAPLTLASGQLRLAPVAAGLETVAARLAVVRAGLAAAELAGTVQGSLDSGLALRFAGPRPASCFLSTGAAGASAERAGGGLARLATWAYRDASSEKLAIARECLARELPAGGDVSLGELERAALAALEAAKANFVLYLRRNVEHYFKARQAAQDAVAAYGETVRKAVGDLSADVVDNLYRTVAVLAGVLLAGLVQPAASLGVLRLATALYAVYLAFVLAVPSRARRDRFDLERAALAERLAAMSELTEAERARLRTPAADAEAHFGHYFAVAAAIYAALGLLALILFILLWTPLGPSLTLPHVAR
jgi:hypothetical protein